MKKISFKDIFVPTVSLFLICLIIAFLLGATNELTKAPIAEQEALKAELAMKNVCSTAETFERDESSEAEAYRGLDSANNLVGYAIPSSHKGYGGDIEIMVGISLEGEVTGVEILSHEETPGLGANCTKEEFTDMFKQPVPEDGLFSVTKDGTGGTEGKIDALTGATISSKAVTEAVNYAISVYDLIEGGGN